jgi:hypothetical protein
MHALSISKVMQFVEYVALVEREPVFIWGQPGVGKSEGIAQLVEKVNGVLCDVRLSQYDSVDLRGFPGVNKETSHTTWHPPSTLPFIGNNNFPDDRPIILFWDEANSAVPAVSAVMYQAINEGRIGEHKFKPNVVQIAAGNRESDRGVTNRQPLPLANRFTHVEATVSVDDFCYWGLQSGKVPPIGVAFIQFRKNLLSTFDSVRNAPEIGKAFATPRTWVKAFKYYMNEKVPVDIKQAAMTGAVGIGPAAEFWGFVDVWQKILPISEIIKNPSGVKLPEGEDKMAMTYATAISVSGHLDPKKKDEVAALHTFLMRLDPEFGVMAWQLAVKRDTKLFQCKEFVDFAKKSKAIFQ